MTTALLTLTRDEPLIAFGGAVKSLGNDGRVGGWIIVYGDANTPDQSVDRQYFTKSTDFWNATKAPVPTLYHHGFDRTLRLKKLSDDTGTTITARDIGLWAETQLNLRDAYERKINELVKDGKLGWSSGSAPHMVRVKKVGNAEEITSWPIVEATLTPTPAEYRAKVVALKSFLSATGGRRSAWTAPPSVKPGALLGRLKLYLHGMREAPSLGLVVPCPHCKSTHYFPWPDPPFSPTLIRHSAPCCSSKALKAVRSHPIAIHPDHMAEVPRIVKQWTDGAIAYFSLNPL